MNTGWVSKRVATARTANKLVSQTMADKFEKLLQTQLSESALSAGELTKIATSILADITSTTPNAKVEK